MTDWIKHNGGPQPVADDVFVQPALEPHDENESNIGPAAWFNWDRIGYYRILNQHLIDAKQAEIDALREDLAIWDSVFPDLLPDRLKSDKQLAEEDVAAKIDAARKEGLQKGLEAFDEARLAVEGDIQKLCDAARLEGIRLGLEAAAKEIVERQELASNCPDGGSEYLRTDHMLADLRALDPETIAREAKPTA